MLLRSAQSRLLPFHECFCHLHPSSFSPDLTGTCGASGGWPAQLVHQMTCAIGTTPPCRSPGASPARIFGNRRLVDRNLFDSWRLWRSLGLRLRDSHHKRFPGRKMGRDPRHNGALTIVQKVDDDEHKNAPELQHVQNRFHTNTCRALTTTISCYVPTTQICLHLD